MTGSRSGGLSREGGPGRAPWTGPALALLLGVTLALRVATGGAVLDHTFHFDERFSFRNVSALLVEGSTRPSNAFYPSLSYLPQAAVLAASEGLHRVSGIEALSIFDEEAPDGWSETAYLLVRLVTAVFGTLGVWLAFVLGRRMFDVRVGLLAATLLSAAPSHVSHSALFKPDVLVALLVTLAFLWGRDAVHAPTLRRYLVAGSAVGLAVAAKYTGVAAALPLAAGSAVRGRRDRRLWLWLAGAGGVAVAVFALLNPHLGTVLAYLPRLWRIYGEKGAAAGGSHLGVVAEQASFLVRNHRLPVALFVLAGLVRAGARVVGLPPGRPADRRRRLDASMLLALPVGYTILYAASTTLFKGQNYLLVLPFTSLLAAWTLVALWDRLRTRLPGRVGGRLAVAVWATVVAAVLVKPVQEVYRVVVPTTFERAGRLLSGFGAVEQRLAYFEREDHPLRVHRRGLRMVTFPVERLSRLPEERLDLADAEVFFARRLDGPDAPFYWRRVAAAPGRPRRLEPGFLDLRGPPLVVLAHPWEPAGQPVELALEPAPGPGSGKNRFRAELPAVAPGERVSFGVWMPLDRSRTRPKTLRVGGLELPLYQTGTAGRRLRVATPRREAPWSGGRAVLQFEERLDLRWVPRVTLYRWRPPGASGG